MWSKLALLVQGFLVTVVLISFMGKARNLLEVVTKQNYYYGASNLFEVATRQNKDGASNLFEVSIKQNNDGGASNLFKVAIKQNNDGDSFISEISQISKIPPFPSIHRWPARLPQHLLQLLIFLDLRILQSKILMVQVLIFAYMGFKIYMKSSKTMMVQVLIFSYMGFKIYLKSQEF